MEDDPNGRVLQENTPDGNKAKHTCGMLMATRHYYINAVWNRICAVHTIPA